MAHLNFYLTLVSLTTILSLLIPTLHAQSAPAPAPSGPIDIFAILEKAGQYTTFIRFLNQTQAGNQINSQVNSSRDGMTVFAPTDNAFQNLPGGYLNRLSNQQQVQLIQYHLLPKYYSLEDLLTVSNPVRTQAGEDFGLNITGQASQVNVSTGVVDVPVYNALRKDPPLAVYQVDKVLQPLEFTGAKAPAASPPAAAATNGTKSTDSGDDKKTPDAPSPANSAGKMSVGLGLVSGLWLMVCYLV